MFARAAERATRLDLGFILVRAALMFPILIAARFLDADQFGEYSQMFHQLLIASTVIVFGVHDRVAVEGAADVPTEVANLAIRLAVVFPIVFVYDDLWLAIATLLFLHFTRSGPMVLLATTRALGEPSRYVVVCLGALASSGVLCTAYAWGASTLTATIAATVAIVPVWILATAKISELPERSPRTVAGAFTGWDYCLNFLMTSLYTQGVLFITSFVTTYAEYATVSRVMYLVQAGILLQSVAYRIVLTSMVDGRLSLRTVLIAHALLGVGWLGVMVLAGGWAETLLFGSQTLDRLDHLLVGALVLLQSFNLALAPHLLARGAVRKTLWVPAATGCVAVVFGATWHLVDSPYMIFAMIGAVTATGLVVRVALVRRLEPVSYA